MQVFRLHTLAVGLALATLIASPALAQTLDAAAGDYAGAPVVTYVERPWTPYIWENTPALDIAILSAAADPFLYPASWGLVSIAYSAGTGAGEGLGVAIIDGPGAERARRATPNPGNLIAHDIAAAFASENGYGVAGEPVILREGLEWFPTKSSTIARVAKGSQYAVDAEPPYMELDYFAEDWTQFRLAFDDRVRIIDTGSGQVIADARCGLSGGTMRAAHTREALYRGNAEEASRVIKITAQECAAQMEEQLELRHGAYRSFIDTSRIPSLLFAEDPPPRPPTLGVYLAEPGDAVDGVRAVEVSSVAAGSVAESAGIRPGDRLAGLAGQAITQPDDLVIAVRTLRPGVPVLATVFRSGRRIDMIVRF